VVVSCGVVLAMDARYPPDSECSGAASFQFQAQGRRGGGCVDGFSGLAVRSW